MPLKFLFASEIIDKADQNRKSSPSAIGDQISKSSHDASLESFKTVGSTILLNYLPSRASNAMRLACV